MTSAAKRSRSVDASSLSQLLGELPSQEEEVLGQLLALAPVPSPEHAAQLLAAVRRIANAVPWFDGAAALLSTSDALAHLEARLVGKFGKHPRLATVGELTGRDYLRTRALIGKESSPRPGPESLRAALVVCGLRWQRESARRGTSIEALGMAIRQITEHQQVAGHESDLLEHLPALAAASNLPAFIQVSTGLCRCDSKSLASAWEEHFLPELHRIASAVTAPLKPDKAAPSPPVDEVDDDENDDDRLVNSIRRLRAKPEMDGSDLEPGEPVDEASTGAVVGAIPLTRTNPDARKLARHLARQVIWSSNRLLLTNHADVLPLYQYRRVMRMLLAELGQQDLDRDLALGMVALLLQAITGRTVKTLGSIQLQAKPGDVRPRGTCGVSLHDGSLELDVFWTLIPSDANPERRIGFYRPEPALSDYFEQVDDSFRLPLHEEVVRVLRLHSRQIFRLPRVGAKDLEDYLRVASRHLRGKVGFPFSIGGVRRSFAAHFHEGCRDTALTQLVAADTLGLSDAPLHYYAPRQGEVAKAYWSFLQELLHFDLRSDADGGVVQDAAADASSCSAISSMPNAFDENRRVGAVGLVTDKWAKRMASISASNLNSGIEGLLAQGKWREIHEVLVMHLACMLLVIAGHRPVDALFKLLLGDIYLDGQGGLALFRDKVHDAAHDPRIAVLAPCLVKQIQAYLLHIQGLAVKGKALADYVQKVMDGKASLLFGINDQGNPVPLKMATWRQSLPEEWRNVRLNWGRTWIRTHAVELGLGSEWASIQLGHLEAIGYPFSNGSPTVPKDVIAVIAPHLEKMARLMGWRVRTGIPAPESASACSNLQPLRSWDARIREHQASARESARQWREMQASRIKSMRQRAEQDVLSHPLLVGRGIPAMLENRESLGKAAPLSRDEAEALRDVLYDNAGDDPALGIARSWALRRILKRANRRLGIHGQDPAPLGVFRRPVDNAFVPGMMVAVNQVEALREHVVLLGSAPPGDWKDFARACARVAYVLAVFGFMEHPEQIEGVLKYRAKGQAPANLSDTILVPWGDRQEQVVALRNLAALSLARLAKRYPGLPVPDRDDLNAALREFIPDWATGKAKEKPRDWLALLCETVVVANRIELSPAVRLALDPDRGSVNASIDEQLALIDGDPVGTVPRDADGGDSDGNQKREEFREGRSTGSARSQYLALCRLLPKTGKELLLPMTGVTVPAHLLVGANTREKVIAEVDAMLAERRPEKSLQPVVRMLALWIRQMLVEGTAQAQDPSDRTIETYLTRIGGTLVEWMGNSSLVDLDEVEVEEAYLAAIMTGKTNRSQAAAAVLDFHRCAKRHFDFPDAELGEVMSYLKSTQRTVDVQLILPQERKAVLLHAAEEVHGHLHGRTREGVRILRQSLAALPMYALGGARRSEVLGLMGADVWGDGRHVSIRICRNRSRRIKTRAAKRTIHFDLRRRPEVGQFSTWADMDGSRQQPWLRDRSFVFSPLDSPRSAEGRDAIARSCAAAISEVTGRSSERLHRFRHLVAFERVVPMFLSDLDLKWISTLPVDDSTHVNNEAALPRDLLGVVVMLGHADWRTTLHSYIHLPWLLRSRQDAGLAKRYMHRRVVAFVTGLTLPAIDKITRGIEKGGEAGAWIDHFRRTRVVPSSREPEIAASSSSLRRWSAVDLHDLFKLTSRMESLEKAVASSGGGLVDLQAIKGLTVDAERKLGRRLFHDQLTHGQSGKARRVVRRLEDAFSRELLEWFTLDIAAERPIFQRLFEVMSPLDGDAIYGPAESIDALMVKLEHYPLIECSRGDQDGLSWIKVVRLRPTAPAGAAGRSKKISLAQVIKGELATAWIAAQLEAVLDDQVP